MLMKLAVDVAVLKTQVGLIMKLCFGVGGIILSDFVWRIIKTMQNGTKKNPGTP